MVTKWAGVAVVLVVVGAACGDDRVSGTTFAQPTRTVTSTTPQPSRTTTATTMPLAYEVTRDKVYVGAASEEAQARRLDVYASSPPRNRPVVVLLHGQGANKDDTHVATVGRQLAEAGLVVFVPTHALSGVSPTGLTAADGRPMREGFESTLCALRYAAEHAAEYGGDPGRISVVGHSAGGFLGLIAMLGGEHVEAAWRDFGEARDTPQQVQCVSVANLPLIKGFVGYNGAYFVLLMTGLSDSDPELWALANPRNYLTAGAAKIRLILGGNDDETPPWHIDEVTRFADELRQLGYDAEIAIIEDAVHNWTTTGPIWDTTLETILTVAAHT